MRMIRPSSTATLTAALNAVRARRRRRVAATTIVSRRAARAVVAVVVLAGSMLTGPRPAHSQQAEPLLVADMAGRPKAEQLLFAALQGIVNRSAPRIYLVNLDGGQDYAVDPTSELWLRDAVDYPLERVDDPYAL